MKNFKLYLDESGVPNLSHYDKNYTLCGIIVQEQQARELKIKADQIKFKYWGHDNIVFHSHEIGSKKNDFAILQNPVTNKNFLIDLLEFLKEGDFKCVIASVNKEKAAQAKWSSGQIIDAANEKIIEAFIEFIALGPKPSHGQIVIESSSAKDIAFYKKYIQYLSHGFGKLKLTGSDIKKLLTSLSFVSKNNHDIEAQLADLFAYPATCKFLHDEKIKPLAPSSYEETICNIMHSKLIPASSGGSMFRMP